MSWWWNHSAPGNSHARMAGEIVETKKLDYYYSNVHVGLFMLAWLEMKKEQVVEAGQRWKVCHGRSKVEIQESSC